MNNKYNPIISTVRIVHTVNVCFAKFVMQFSRISCEQTTNSYTQLFTNKQLYCFGNQKAYR